MQLSISEENYLKTILKIGMKNGYPVSTNSIAHSIHNKAASVSDMLKKLAEKDLIQYQLYKGASLTSKGNDIAMMQLRKHRLWECFLVNKLSFSWNEIHEIAEELEHINSVSLIDKLDEFLGFPKNDPHGDPIPDKMGKIQKNSFVPLSEIKPNKMVKILGVLDSSDAFLVHLNKLKLQLGTVITVMEIDNYDNTFIVEIEGNSLSISSKVAQNLLVEVG
jgi:DtxR family Mn-dependent transcriptional regulator